MVSKNPQLVDEYSWLADDLDAMFPDYSCIYLKVNASKFIDQQYLNKVTSCLENKLKTEMGFTLKLTVRKVSAPAIYTTTEYLLSSRNLMIHKNKDLNPITCKSTCVAQKRLQRAIVNKVGQFRFFKDFVIGGSVSDNHHLRTIMKDNLTVAEFLTRNKNRRRDVEIDYRQGDSDETDYEDFKFCTDADNEFGTRGFEAQKGMTHFKGKSKGVKSKQVAKKRKSTKTSESAPAGRQAKKKQKQ